MKLNSRIRQARHHAGFSQQEMSERIGVTRGAVANWESVGAIAPTVEHMLKLAQLTRVNFEWLATGHGAMTLTETASRQAPPAPDVVRDGDERWLLQLFRQVPKRQRTLVLDVVELHARKQQA